MAFALRPDDRNLTAALRRIARGELGPALAQVAAGAPDAPAVHDVRKRIKKLRGLLRLVRPGVPAARDEVAALRGVAQGLAPVRDAEVALDWAGRLGAAQDGALGAWLAARVETARAGTDMPAALAAARQGLAAMEGRLPGWRVRGKDAAVLQRALERTLARGARSMAAVRDTGAAEAMHDWRKRVKDLWYQARLLSPVWPAGLAPWRDTADDLGERLGEYNDLAVLALLLDGAGGDAAAEAAVIRAKAQRMAADIASAALVTGARLHAAPPETAAALILSWWRVWRAG